MIPLSHHVTRVPVSCVWEITTACNLRCVHCELDADGARPGELSTQEMLAAADALADAGCRDVSLTGGEPLLRNDWPELAAHLSSLGLQVKIVTNGTGVDAAAVHKMLHARVAGVAVSLDGEREVHDSLRVPRASMGSRFDQAIAALHLLKASRLRTAVITQIHRRNIHDLPAIYERLAAIGVEVWQVQLTYPLGRLLQQPAPLLIDPGDLPFLHETLASLAGRGRVRILTADNIGYYAPQEPLLRSGLGGMSTFWTGCMAGCLGVCICSNGDVKGCPSHPDSFCVGNLRQESFADIWRDAARFAYNTRWEERLLEGECARCPFRCICRAGCTSMAFAVTGTIYDNPYCWQRVR